MKPLKCVPAVGTIMLMSIAGQAQAADAYKICVSAGMRGLQIEIAPADYLRATGARVAEIAKPKS